MSKIKKVKVVEEVKVEEPKEEPIKESEARQELRKAFAILKAQNPEGYAAKNKDAQLAKRLETIS